MNLLIRPEAHEEHDHFEAIPGLPEALPPGERIVWQGQPDWIALAREAFHVRGVALYFALLASYGIVSGVHDGEALTAVLTNAALLLAVGTAAVLLLGLLAWATASQTIYTLTNHRVVLAIGVALQIRLNLPFNRIDEVQMRCRKTTGDIVLTPAGKDRISYVVLWPHARPWRLSRPEPALRCLPDAEFVAGELKSLIEGSHVAAADRVYATRTDAPAAGVLA